MKLLSDKKRESELLSRYFAGDEEAGAPPCIVRLADGSDVDLPALLAAAGPAILGE